MGERQMLPLQTKTTCSLFWSGLTVSSLRPGRSRDAWHVRARAQHNHPVHTPRVVLDTGRCARAPALSGQGPDVHPTISAPRSAAADARTPAPAPPGAGVPSGDVRPGSPRGRTSEPCAIGAARPAPFETDQPRPAVESTLPCLPSDGDRVPWPVRGGGSTTPDLVPPRRRRAGYGSGEGVGGGAGGVDGHLHRGAVGGVGGVGRGAGDRRTRCVDEHGAPGGAAGDVHRDVGVVADLGGQRVLEVGHLEEPVVGDGQVDLVVVLPHVVDDRLLVDRRGAGERATGLRRDLVGAAHVRGAAPTAVCVMRTISCCTDCGSRLREPNRTSAPTPSPTRTTSAATTTPTIRPVRRRGAAGGGVTGTG